MGFYLSWQVRCRSVGIEYDDRIFQAALKNQEGAVFGRRVEFHKNRAELYPIPEEADRLYFFNPFSVEVLRKVMGRIRETWYACPREILLFFYYPAEEYVACLMTVDELSFLDEIDCMDLFDGRNKRERILVFRMEG